MQLQELVICIYRMYKASPVCTWLSIRMYTLLCYNQCSRLSAFFLHMNQVHRNTGVYRYIYIYIDISVHITVCVPVYVCSYSMLLHV
jgi:hypothetical protein